MSERVIGLPRCVAQELVLLAILAPLAVSNLGAVLADSLYATDASEQKGAFVSSTAPPFLVRSLWRTGSKKGGYSRIFSREEALLAKHLDPEPYDLRLLQSQTSVSPSRPLAFRFDFIEVFSSSGRLTEALSAKGWVVGPPLDIARSPAYDLQNLRVLDWLLHMLEGRTLRSLALGPPGSTFSCAASPSLRSDTEPRGFSPSEPRTLLGNTLALRALTLVFVALRMGAVALLEQPRKSKMARLSEWKRLLLLGAREVFLASCSFGSVHLKEFRFLVVNADFSRLQQPCTRNHSHVKIQGKHTAASSVYVPFLADAIAHEFDQALRAQAHVAAAQSLKAEGLENFVVNDVVLSLPWRVGKAWAWRAMSHINILELASVLRLLRFLAPHGSLRIVVFVDSAVALQAASKGRSPSRGLTPILRKVAAVCLAADLYPVFHFCPTRLNPADCPTRDTLLPPPSDHAVWPELTIDQLYEGLAATKVRRWLADWERLVCLLAGPPPGLSPVLDWRDFRHSSRLFDSTLGFPGEGPFLASLAFFFCGRLLCLFFLFLASPGSSGCSGWGFKGCHGMLLPRDRADQARQAAREHKTLAEGRPVEEPTQRRRQKFLEAFERWLGARGFDFKVLLTQGFEGAPEMNRLLTDFGRELFAAGWPYSHYSETINGVAALQPALRRVLTPAWDLAFSWLREEPHTHHLGMPWQVLLACVSVALLWGWVPVMRVGEVLGATRSDLTLPADLGGTIWFALLSIAEPKTRFRAARRQVARLDQPDLLRVVAMAFGHYAPERRLWPFSPSTLRSRFSAVVKALSLDRLPGGKQLDLGSLRAGGATWLLHQTENSELVRRRGRWLNHHSMEIYVQEVAALHFLSTVPAVAKTKVLSLLEGFQNLLFRAEALQRAGVRSISFAWVSSRNGWKGWVWRKSLWAYYQELLQTLVQNRSCTVAAWLA